MTNIRPNLNSLSEKDYKKLSPIIHTDLAPALQGNFGENTNSNSTLKIYRTLSENNHSLFTHNSFDILYTLDHEAVVTVCSEKLQLKKYNLLLIAPGIPYSIDTPDNSMLIVISIDTNGLSSQFHSISKLQGIIPGFFADAMWGEVSFGYVLFTSVTNENINSIIHMLISEELHSVHGSDYIKLHLFISLLGYLCAAPQSTYRYPQLRIVRSEHMSKILAFIQDNYRTVTLEKLAANFHYTVPYVSKLIRNATGLTFTEILREIKFDVCRSLLLNSDLKINKIAEVAGFPNTDHFNRVFKKHMGITPTEFKKKSIDK